MSQLSFCVALEPDDESLPNHFCFRRNSPSRGREARVIQTVEAPQFYNNQAPQFQNNQKYIPTSEAFLTRRVGEAAEAELSMRRPPDARVTSNLVTPQNYQQQQYQQQQQQATLKLQAQSNRQYQFNSPREVSETDLYLLGAIEKLVYRVDYMEKRLKRTEQLVYYLMAGNKQKPEAEPCPSDFTKVGENCYHFGSSERVDWKTAATNCKSLGSSLAEFDKIEKFQDVIAAILSNQTHRGHDFWVGGLNPGLLWIWATSAKPVNPNANLSSFNKKTETINKVPVKVLNQATNKTETTLSTDFPEITGQGRCLRLSYNPSLFNYGYTGHDCSAKQHYMCIILDKTLDNEIKRIAKELKFDV
jgi:hypothetical protein